MTPFISWASRRIDAALLVLRSVVGVVFVAHGAQKLFVYGFDGVTGAFAQMGIPAAGIMAPLVAIVEFFAGALLIFGLVTRVAALLLGIEMLGAILLVHLPQGFFLPNGSEFALTLLAASSALALAGAGAYSLDAWLALRRGNWIVERVSVRRHA